MPCCSPPPSTRVAPTHTSKKEEKFWPVLPSARHVIPGAEHPAASPPRLGPPGSVHPVRPGRVVLPFLKTVGLDLWFSRGSSTDTFAYSADRIPFFSTVLDGRSATCHPINHPLVHVRSPSLFFFEQKKIPSPLALCPSWHRCQRRTQISFLPVLVASARACPV